MYIWFSRRLDLNKLLENWRNVGSNYDPDQPIDQTWHVDGFEAVIGHKTDKDLFEKSVSRLFSYEIYPSDVLSFSADFVIEKRTPRVGDRIIQRIHVIPAVLDVITMNIVSAAWHEPDRRGFTMITSENHYEMGEWTATISRKRSGDIAFMMHSISRPSTRMPIYGVKIARSLQIRGHQKAVENFKKISGQAT